MNEIFLTYICKEKNYVFADLHFVVRKNSWVSKSQIRKSKKYMVCKLQIRKLPHLVKVRKSRYKLSPQICGFAELICGPPTFELLPHRGSVEARLWSNPKKNMVYGTLCRS